MTDDQRAPAPLPPAPLPPALTPIIEDLDRLSGIDRRRRLIPIAGRDFSSNDYLGLAGSPDLRHAVEDAVARGVPVGSGGSRLLRGNHAEHAALEAEAAVFFGSESALWFGSGFSANAALLATLPQRGDLLVHDTLIPARAPAGKRMARAPSVAAGHNDPDAIEDAIRDWRRQGGTGSPWIAVESLYSMDGDQAPLSALAAVATRHDAMLLIDEAHATGVFGPDGRGLAAALEGQSNVVTLRTCGKALGSEGALVCGPAVVTDFLVNRARGFIFSTAPSPVMAAAVRAGLRILRDEPERRARLVELVRLAAERLGPLGARVSGSQILPLIVGEDGRAMALASALQARGFDVRGIRPPTVPAGTARLRISLTLNIDAGDIAALGDAMEELA
ncbi:8-amino-7-oxononanoate synthase [uncultured Sphingomonas sp.]|uniref:8-amino-7-oxononanoate synthase n=1 Tax=uncultured Sphingomonas sp. TaxID=158754 RepID=UPI0025D7B13E|nr:8-amino-7-oxononanoate synthase [uncultured Sphingomonas sp.]